MKKNILGTHFVTQIGILVHDIEKTAQVYADFLGVDKPEVMITDAIDKSETKYRGQPSEARSKLAFFKVGDNLELELIEPDPNPNSTWREALEKNGEGVHHIAFVVEKMGEKIRLLQENNMELVQTGEFEGGRYAYVDASADLKTVIELLEFDKKS
jgi:methylmalonyl-CoA/ethylmalonyl-CoA epimerase